MFFLSFSSVFTVKPSSSLLAMGFVILKLLTLPFAESATTEPSSSALAALTFLTYTVYSCPASSSSTVTICAFSFLSYTLSCSSLSSFSFFAVEYCTLANPAAFHLPFWIPAIASLKSAGFHFFLSAYAVPFVTSTT